MRSIVGRFLEHSRIYYFQNGGEEEIYMGSADWMPRNLHERVEVVFPLRDPLLRERVKNEILAAYLADNVKARILQRGGSYVREEAKGKTAPFSAQEFLIDVAEGQARRVVDSGGCAGEGAAADGEEEHGEDAGGEGAWQGDVGCARHVDAQRFVAEMALGRRAILERRRDSSLRSE